ncbi:MAG: response regulator [Opitutales bacterium]|nr:response regulator [Opitutales bacterium]MCH8541089.1 response regulator [Opitutales bacterium]
MKSPELTLLLVDDEADVLDSLARDLSSFEDHFALETASDANEAKKLLESIKSKGHSLALIFCDHVMPGQSGVDFLIELAKDKELNRAKKVLFTGQAGQEDTIEALNRAQLDHYVAKPWDREELLETTRKLLTDFVLENKINPIPYMSILDTERLANDVARRDLFNDSI